MECFHWLFLKVFESKFFPSALLNMLNLWQIVHSCPSLLDSFLYWHQVGKIAQRTTSNLLQYILAYICFECKANITKSQNQKCLGRTDGQTESLLELPMTANYTNGNKHNAFVCQSLYVFGI